MLARLVLIIALATLFNPWAALFTVTRTWAIGVLVCLAISRILLNKRKHSGTVAVLSTLVCFGFSAFLFLFANPRYFFIYAVAFGNLLNFLVMLVNRGRMPVEPDKINKHNRKLSADSSLHQIASETTHMRFLDDRFYVSILSYKIISVGDIILSFGIILLLLQSYLA